MVSENKISEIRIAYEALAYISPNHELLRYFAIDRKGNLAFRTEESIQDFRRRFGEDVLEAISEKYYESLVRAIINHDPNFVN